MADTPATSNVIWDFLRETVNRLGQKNPKFFTVLSWLAAATAAATGLPAFLENISELGITLPSWIDAIQDKVVAWSAIIAVFIANLTVKRDPVIVTEEKVVTEATVEKLPFTVKAEAVAAEKAAEKL